MKYGTLLLVLMVLVAFPVQAEKMYELDESINLSELKDKLELFKRTRKVVGDNMGAILKIHTKHKQTNPKLVGQLVVKLEINSKGGVTKYKVVKSQLGSKEFHNDIVLAIQGWDFGQLPKEKQEVLIPFYFK